MKLRMFTALAGLAVGILALGTPASAHSSGSTASVPTGGIASVNSTALKTQAMNMVPGAKPMPRNIRAVVRKAVPLDRSEGRARHRRRAAPFRSAGRRLPQPG